MFNASRTDYLSPLITGNKIANSPFLQSVLNQNQSQQQQLMPETGGMLFPCTVREEVPQLRSEAQENPEARASAQQVPQGQDHPNANATAPAKDRWKNPVRSFLEQSQSQRQLLLQQAVHAEKPPLELRGDGAQKLNVKSMPNTSIQNTPTLNIEWVS